MPPIPFPEQLVVRGAVLEQGSSLEPGQGIKNPTGRFTLTLLRDGNIVVWEGRDPLWAADVLPNAAPRDLVMQQDGNLVAYDVRGQPYWSSHTCGRGRRTYRLKIQDDGNAVVYANGEATWAAHSWKVAGVLFRGTALEEGGRLRPGEGLRSECGRFMFIFQRDANVVLYQWTTPLWASHTWKRCTPGHITLRRDGTLAAHDDRGSIYWESHSARQGVFGFGRRGSGPFTLKVQECGNVAMLNGTGVATWQTRTGRQGGGSRGPHQVRGNDRLLQDCSLLPGERLHSRNGRFSFSLCEDADIVVSRGDLTLWSSETGNKCVPGRIVLQPDGNLVAYDAQGDAYWASNTHGRNSQPLKLVMQDDGNCVVYSGSRATWDTGTWKTADVRCAGATLLSGAELEPNGALRSSTGRFTFIFQTDANVVLYDWTSPIWASDTWNRCTPGRLLLQDDGNLVAFTNRGERYWASNSSTNGVGPCQLALGEDGNVVLQDGNGNSKWETGTAEIQGRAPGGEEFVGDSLAEGGRLFPGEGLRSGNGRYCFRFQTDGNIVLYRGDEALWASNTCGLRGRGYLVMQSDGNLVAYDRQRRPFWASNTWQQGTGPFTVTLQNDGNVVLRDGQGLVTWETSPVEDGIGDGDDFESSEAEEDTGGGEGEGASPGGDADRGVVPEGDGEADEGEEVGGGEEQPRRACVICMECPCQGVCVPCGHMVACMRCLRAVQCSDKRCPICRRDIQQVVKVYQA